MASFARQSFRGFELEVSLFVRYGAVSRPQFVTRTVNVPDLLAIYENELE